MGPVVASAAAPAAAFLKNPRRSTEVFLDFMTISPGVIATASQRAHIDNATPTNTTRTSTTGQTRSGGGVYHNARTPRVEKAGSAVTSGRSSARHCAPPESSCNEL